MADERQRRLARNEAVAREVNEAVKSIAAEWYADDEAVNFHCECSDAACSVDIPLLRSDYEWIRASPTRFLVAAGHEDLELERVVRELDGALVVEKLGPGEDVAVSTDPRS
jgi:hypothetical protein